MAPTVAARGDAHASGKLTTRSPTMSDHGGKTHWDAIYSAKAPEEVSWYQARPETSLGLIARSGKGLDARFIDVGGGASRVVDLLLDEGYRHVTVLDLSEVALARAQVRLGSRASRVTWVTADVTTWTPSSTYDLWHDRAVFHFLVRAEDRRRYLAALVAAVPPGGQVILGTFASDGPERCSGLPVMRYEPDTLSAEVGPMFRRLESLHEDHLTPAGKVQRFQFSRFVRT
jgi:SAM-dependent methyltransferase